MSRTSIGSSVDRVPPVVLVLSAVVSVQFGGALAATLVPQVGAPGTVALRMVISALVLWPVVRPRLRGRTASDWRIVGVYAAALALMNLSFYESLARLPIGVAVTIEFVGPLVLAAVLSRKGRDLIAVLAAAIGVVLISGALWTPWSELDLVGIVFALLAGAMWALYILAGGRTAARFAQLDGLAIALALGSVVLLPLGFATAGTTLLEPAILLKGLGIAMLSSLIAYSLELLALGRMSAGVFGVLLSLEPAVAALAGLVVLSQTLSPIQLLGMSLVVLASVTVMSRRRSAEPQDGG